MPKLEIKTLVPAQAYALFNADPHLPQKIIEEADAMAHLAEKGDFSNASEALSHAELLFTLAYVFSITANKKEFFQMIGNV